MAYTLVITHVHLIYYFLKYLLFFTKRLRTMLTCLTQRNMLVQ